MKKQDNQVNNSTEREEVNDGAIANENTKSKTVVTNSNMIKNVLTYMMAVAFTACVIIMVGLVIVQWTRPIHGENLATNTTVSYATEDHVASEQSTFNGEEIANSDNFGWLLAGANSLTPCNLAIKAELTTDACWYDENIHEVVLELPDKVFTKESKPDIWVFYTTELKAGENGMIAVFVADGNYTYCSYCQFHALDDMQIIHGNNNSDTDSGSEFNMNVDGEGMTLYFSSTTSVQYDDRSSFVTLKDDYGDVLIKFIDINDTPNALSNPKV